MKNSIIAFAALLITISISAQSKQQQKPAAKSTTVQEPVKLTSETDFIL